MKRQSTCAFIAPGSAVIIAVQCSRGEGSNVVGLLL